MHRRRGFASAAREASPRGRGTDPTRACGQRLWRSARARGSRSRSRPATSPEMPPKRARQAWRSGLFPSTPPRRRWCVPESTGRRRTTTRGAAISLTERPRYSWSSRTTSASSPCGSSAATGSMVAICPLRQTAKPERRPPACRLPSPMGMSLARTCSSRRATLPATNAAGASRLRARPVSWVSGRSRTLRYFRPGRSTPRFSLGIPWRRAFCSLAWRRGATVMPLRS